MSDAAFLTDFHEVALIGATASGGVDRQAATPEDRRTREWFREFAERRGWEHRVDAIGNQFALIEFVPDAPYLLLGSHLDSQPLGGRFDGAYGVIAALHAADRIQRRAEEGPRPDRNLAVVNWFNEEGSRFAPSIMGSSVFAGIMDETEMLGTTDLDGVSVAEALEAIGYRGEGSRPTLAGYAEIHIEQGRILEREGIDLGAVDFSWYTQKLDIEIHGEQSHTGATAMADRRDALVGAARLILKVREVVAEFEPETLVSSVGRFTHEPNSPIVVPRHARLVADLRSVSKDTVLAARARLLEEIERVAAEEDLEITATDFDVRDHQRFPEAGVALVEQTAADLGLSVRRIRTMAGHDSIAMNRITPSLMIFIPSVDGVSHCEREFTRDADMLNGLAALSEVAWRMLQGALDRVEAEAAR
ncbi:MAG: M20 family metallo-hydrolase [Microbacteriaceae bacterium]|nr:M20 family metallo-hydrolase [Microbacteriaceae bacterium]